MSRVESAHPGEQVGQGQVLPGLNGVAGGNFLVEEAQPCQPPHCLALRKSLGVLTELDEVPGGALLVGDPVAPSIRDSEVLVVGGVLGRPGAAGADGGRGVRDIVRHALCRTG